jgi:serine phosphatase RsbU (regulator of sigma subunit)
MKIRVLITILAAGISRPLLAGAGFWNTLFGDGDHEFICYSRVHRNYYLAIFGAVIILGLVAYGRYRLKKKTAEELRRQKDVIEEQNKEILASIRYASRMQEAQKPDEDLVRKLIPQSFFLLRPRDIVSGDFYFVEEWNGKVVIAAVDCTGHGVPGAFLTFIGNNALRHALEKITDGNPTRILDAMNSEVKKALGQERATNELNDGMEVGLCVFDPKNNSLEYAGAGAPLYIVRNGSLEEIRPAKCTVGSIQDHVKEPPQTHALKLAAGDTFYLCSDGIADQFGGKEGKKFRREQLKSMLAGIQSLSLDEQRSGVEKTITEWMGGFSQTDDMLLLGVRV